MGDPNAPDGPHAKTPGAGADADAGPRLRVYPGSRRRRSAEPPRPRVAPSPEEFLSRLQSLEAQVEDALGRARTGAGGIGQDLLIEAVNQGLGLYAQVRRELPEIRDLWVRARMLGRGAAVDDFGYDAAFAAWAEPVLDALYGYWWRVEAINVERVPARGRVVLVANHGGALLPYDALMVATALRTVHPAHRRARPLVEDYLYYWPHVGTALARLGAVRAARANARRLLEREEAVIAFPEGARGLGKPYRERYRLQRFGRGGFVRLALEAHAPIVPVAVIGAEEAHPVVGRAVGLGRLVGLPYVPITPTFPWLGALGLVPLPSKWIIRFGEPINLMPRYEAADPGDPAVVGRVREEVRQRIQRMLVEGLRRRRSIFFG
jgi:1-acyl-sn-glycerol-3-phosphate acyltransferase